LRVSVCPPRRKQFELLRELLLFLDHMLGQSPHEIARMPHKQPISNSEIDREMCFQVARKPAECRCDKVGVGLINGPKERRGVIVELCVSQ
jgi:hypothetical protein